MPPAVTRSLNTAIDLARTHIVEARRSMSELRPRLLDGRDLGSALRELTDAAERTCDVPITLSIDELPALPASVEDEILRITQEALTNAARHARAKRITVRAASSAHGQGLRLSVSDDGRGFDPNRTTGFGMTSMQERAERIGASLTIVTAPRHGAEVVLAWSPASTSAAASAPASDNPSFPAIGAPDLEPLAASWPGREREFNARV